MTIQRDHRSAVKTLKRLFGKEMIFRLASETITDVVSGRKQTVSIEVTVRKGMWCDASVAAAFRLSGMPDTGITHSYKRIIIDRNDIPISHLSRLLDESDPNITVVIDSRKYVVRKIIPHSSGQVVEYYVEGT